MSVPWRSRALDQLAELYVPLNVDQQRILAELVETVNAILALDPLDQGESRDGNRRLWFPGPLQVLYEVTPSGGVIVDEVGWASRRR